MSVIYAVNLPYRVKCNLPGCHSGNIGGAKITNHPYKIEVDGRMLTFCSPQHARLGEERWFEKKDVRLGVPPRQEEQMVSDNIEEVINENG